MSLISKLEKLVTPVRAAGAALGLVAGLSVLPGCTSTSAKAVPTTTSTAIPTATPTYTPTPTPSPVCTPNLCSNGTPTSYACPNLNVGQQINFNGHPIQLYGLTSNNPPSAGLTVDGSLVWMDPGDCQVINSVGIKLCSTSNAGQGSAYFCASQ